MINRSLSYVPIISSSVEKESLMSQVESTELSVLPINENMYEWIVYILFLLAARACSM